MAKQKFAKESITIEKKVTLNYPSVIALYNNKESQKAFILIEEEVKIAGLVFLFGNDLIHLDKNTLEIKEKGKKAQLVETPIELNNIVETKVLISFK